MAEKTARVVRIETVAPDMLLVACRMVDPPALPFRAGQFLSLRLGDDGKVRRSYSLASSPARQDGFDLLVKVVPGGVGSDWFLALAPGRDLHFTGPMGFFVCDLAHAGDVVFAATGAGIAPVVPMIEEILARPGEAGRVLLYWGLRREADVFFADRLAAFAARSPRCAWHVCLSRASTEWAGVNGRLTQHVLTALPRLDRPVFYLCGNGSMIRDLKQGLVDLGVDRKRQIRAEVFYPASEPR